MSRTLASAFALLSLVLTSNGTRAAPGPSVALAAAAPPPAPATYPCGELQACLAALPSTAAHGDGITGEEQALARALQRHGRAAVPALLRHLEHPDEDVRALVAYTLGDIDGLTHRDLPALLTALRRGQQWIAHAVARIGTAAAIDALYDELVMRPETETQVTNALASAGRKSVRALLRAFNCRVGCSAELLTAAASVFEDLGEEGAGAVRLLVAVAMDERRSELARRAALQALGHLGPTARVAARPLARLALREPAFAETVQEALQGMKSPEAAPGLAAALAKAPSVDRLRDLAELGPAGRAAAPSVLASLAREDWELRVAAARALGYMAAPGTIDPLIKALDDEANWQLVYVAAESLGRIGDARATPALRSLAARHFYPPVGSAARKAMAVISGRDKYVSRWHAKNFALEFMDYEHAGRDVEPCLRRPGDHRGGPGAGFSPNADLARALRTIATYDSTIVSYVGGEGGKAERKETRRKETPGAALEVEDGWLLGASRGEWGGELVFVNASDREQVTLLEENVLALARFGGRILALSGLAHLFSNRGVVHEVRRDGAGRWSTRPWRLLPGAPLGSEERPGGRWLIHTNGGSVLLAADGEMRMATCEDR